MIAFWIATMLLVLPALGFASMVASILLWNCIPMARSRFTASLTSSTNTRHSCGSAIPRPAWIMSANTASGGLKKLPSGPTVRMVQKSARGFDVAPAPRVPGTPKRPLTASIVRAPASCAAIVAAVAAPPPPATRTSVR